MRYSYHGRIRQRIRAGELAGYYYASNYPRIGQALVLVFTTYPPLRPVRPHKWPEYSGILADWEKTKKDRPEGGASERPGPQTYEKTENDRKSIVTQFPPFRKPNLEGGEGADAP